MPTLDKIDSPIAATPDGAPRRQLRIAASGQRGSRRAASCRHRSGWLTGGSLWLTGCAVLSLASCVLTLSGCAGGLQPVRLDDVCRTVQPPLPDPGAASDERVGDHAGGDVVQVGHQTAVDSPQPHPGSSQWVGDLGAGKAGGQQPAMRPAGHRAALAGAGAVVGKHHLPPPAMIPNPQGTDPNEFLCNGGDRPPAAVARGRDELGGVEVGDVVARYRTDSGAVHVTESNPACLYAPRFGAVRRVTGAQLGELAEGPARVLHRDGPSGLGTHQPGLDVTGRDEPIRSQRTRGPDAMRARNRGVRVENIQQPMLADETLAMLANLSIIQRGELIKDDLPVLYDGIDAAVRWSVNTEVVVAVAEQTAATVTRDQAARELVVYDYPGPGRLRLCKVADKADALPGDVVTFMLRIDNVGDSALHDVVISDSLATRLEYVPESQTVMLDADPRGEGEEPAEIDAEFRSDANDGQSLQLTWKLPVPLAVGQGATIQFRCRVR